MYSLLGTLSLLQVALDAALLLLVRQSVSDYNRGGHPYGSARSGDTAGTVGSSTAITFQATINLWFPNGPVSQLGLGRLGRLHRCLDSLHWAL